MNKNSGEKKLNSGKKKRDFLSELHTTKKCATKNLYKNQRFFAQNR